MDDFCACPLRKRYNELGTEVKQKLYAYSLKIMRSELRGDYRMAHRIISYHEGKPLEMAVVVPTGWRTSRKVKGWVCDEIAAGVEFYRAGKSLTEKRPTYFALEVGNANQYLPTKKEGCLTVYRSMGRLRLFQLDNVNNINRLLLQLHKSKEDHLYRVVLTMFYPPLIKNYKKLYESTILQETHPVQFKRLVRYSLISNDFVFANWLCQEGFQGYSAGVMDIYSGAGRVRAQFPEEVLLCDPLSVLEVVSTFSTKRKSSRESLDALLDSQKK